MNTRLSKQNPKIFASMNSAFAVAKRYSRAGGGGGGGGGQFGLRPRRDEATFATVKVPFPAMKA